MESNENLSKEDLPFTVPKNSIKQIKKVILDENSFRTISRPDLYSFFDNILKIRDKKFLLESEKDIDIWEEDINNKIEKVINLLDGFLENIVLYRDTLSSELRKYLCKSKLEEITYFDVHTYMSSKIWDIQEGLKIEEDGKFDYEKYVDLEEFSIYQILSKPDKSKFILILIPSYKNPKILINFKKEDDSNKYYRLDLTEAYKLSNKLFEKE